jgi:enoyl-CoA hydratase
LRVKNWLCLFVCLIFFLKIGLVSRVVADEQLLTLAGEMATKIASYSHPVVALCKESLAEGVRLERKLFYSTFALEDRKIGMQAFVDKAKPAWKNQ